MLGLTLVIRKVEDGFIGQVKELPEVLTQGDSIEEVKENIVDALDLYFDYMREKNSDNNNVVYEEVLAIA